MALALQELPKLTWASRGSDYPAFANHFALSFERALQKNPLWLCWEVDVQWASTPRKAATGERRPPGKARVLAAVEARLERIPELAAGGDAPRWVFDGRRRLYTPAAVNWSGVLPPGMQDGVVVRVTRSRDRDGDGAPQEIDLSRLGSEERRFVHVYIGQQARRRPGHVAVGRRVFIEEAAVPEYLRSFPHGDIVQGREMWLGYFASLEPSMGGCRLGSTGCVQLNVNVTAGFGIPQQSLQHLIGVLASGKQENESPHEDLHSYWKPWKHQMHAWMAQADEEHWNELRWLNAEWFGIKNLKVTTPILGYRSIRAVRGISSQSPQALRFMKDGRQTDVREYMESKYNRTLRHPSLPCVDLGTKERKDWVPIEFVEVMGGEWNLTRKLSDRMLECMVRRLAVRPAERLRWIKQALWDVPDMQHLGLSVDWNPVKLTLRRIPEPALQCGGPGAASSAREATGKGKPVKLSFEHGCFNPGRVRVLQPPRAPVRWMMLSYVPEFQWEDLQVLRAEIVRNAHGLGADFEDNPWIEEAHSRLGSSGDLGDYLWRYRREVDLIVALLPPKSLIYGNLKAACAECGLHSACLNPLAQPGRGQGKGSYKGKGKGKLQGNLGQDLAARKILLFLKKVLENLGTVVRLDRPHRLLAEGTMLLGADVRHQSGAASIAGATASFGPPFTRYFASCRAQLPPAAQEGQRQRKSREHIEDLKGMVVELLRHHRGPYPKRVLVCRDGVSEGQFDMQRDELVGLLGAFEAHGAPRPGVAWIVVQKRHGTRLFPGQQAEALPNGNVVPGVVADRGIAHPSYENWFAVSHRAIQGTAVPAHYFVLHNSLDATKDDLVELMDQLCHLYPRASCAVSYPTPAYYADHLCERAFELGVNTRGLTDCDALNEYFRGAELGSSPLQGTHFFC